MINLGKTDILKLCGVFSLERRYLYGLSSDSEVLAFSRELLRGPPRASLASPIIRLLPTLSTGARTPRTERP